jgi:phosphate transport system substrate-binding protein
MRGTLKALRLALWLLAGCLSCAGPALAQPGTGQHLVIPGTGDSQTLLRDLAELFMRANPGVSVEIPDSVGSSGGRKAVRDGRATLGRVANSSAAKEAGGGLAYLEFARTPVVFAVNTSVVGVTDITPQQALGIYSGTIADWTELGGRPGKIYPIARETGDSSWSAICANLPGFRDIASPAGKIFYTTPEALKAVQDHPGTIGFGPQAMFASGRVRILSLAGKKPYTPEAGLGDYPISIPLALIWKGDPGPLERRFLEFVRSSATAPAIRRHLCIPVEGTP